MTKMKKSSLVLTMMVALAALVILAFAVMHFPALWHTSITHIAWWVSIPVGIVLVITALCFGIAADDNDSAVFAVMGAISFVVALTCIPWGLQNYHYRNPHISVKALHSLARDNHNFVTFHIVGNYNDTFNTQNKLGRTYAIEHSHIRSDANSIISRFENDVIYKSFSDADAKTISTGAEACTRADGGTLCVKRETDNTYTGSYKIEDKPKKAV